jgi:YVTN family beta-propeller protein
LRSTRHRVVKEIPVGKNVTSVALSPDFKWLAAVDRGGAQVALLDASTGTVARTLPLGTHPRAAVWDSANPRWLYVAVEDDDAVTIVDRTRGAVETTIAVGRLPSGVAVSKSRRELYVTHRIDAAVTIVDLAKRAVDKEVPLADEPASDDPKTPHGKPFAFESLAWAADGDTAWLPHELLAPTRPFQFQTTLFPAVSVVDLGAFRAEVTTNPYDPSGIIAGRKNLFDAINVLDTTGTPQVISQPCAAALHPSGSVGWVLACASEDLVVFDAATGIATDLVRDLPGDHPFGLALDDTAQRLFVISDQSHTLLVFDTADGSPVAHTTRRGDPIPLAARDPVDPALRLGLTLFFRANSGKGALATTANDWMACAGCHLDGLVSTNAFFFEALRPADPTKDAQIGHLGLTDVFATAPTPDDPAFDPHDLLVALRDQGGLDGDRTGAHPHDVVDPSAPTADAVAMARALGRVVGRDLPVGPSWLLDTSGKPDDARDGAWCGACHQPEYDAWKKSVHARSADDPMMEFCAGVEKGLRGAAMTKHCAGCHDPVSTRLGDTSLTKKRGITCLGCHDVTRTIRAGGNADLEAQSHTWDVDHYAWAKASLEKLRDPKFCGGCHQQFVPGTGLLPAFSTLSEYEGSGIASRCVDCHMPIEGAVADHRMVGGNLYAGTRIGDAQLIADQRAKLQSFLTLGAARNGNAVDVTVQNRASGHAFPTGVSDIREAWIEVQAVDPGGKVLARIGGPGADGTIPADAARLGTDVASADGTVLLKHELTAATRITFDRRVMPKQSLTVSVPLPATLPAGTATLEAVVFYRNLRTPYYRLAVGDTNALPPETELVRAKVP